MFLISVYKRDFTIMKRNYFYDKTQYVHLTFYPSPDNFTQSLLVTFRRTESYNKANHRLFGNFPSDIEIVLGIETRFMNQARYILQKGELNMPIYNTPLLIYTGPLMWFVLFEQFSNTGFSC